MKNSFNILRMTQQKEFRQLKDYDVLGVGAARRAKLEEDAGNFILEIHPDLVPPSQKEFYQIVLQQTQAWLNPQSTQEIKIPVNRDEFLFQILLEDFKKSFPRVSAHLQAKLPLHLKDYLREFPWQGPLLSDQFRYFPRYLKLKIQDSRLYLIAQQEWLWSYLSFADFGQTRAEPGRVRLNPSLQVLHTPVEIEELALTPGLYIYYYEDSTCEVREYKMDVWDAAVVDMLQEDRKFTLDQLLEQVLLMDLEGPLPKDEWRKKIHFLISQGILSLSGSEKN